MNLPTVYLLRTKGKISKTRSNPSKPGDHRHESVGCPAAGDCQRAVWAAISLLDGPNGCRTILDPSRLFGPVIAVEGESVTMPQLTAPELQNQNAVRSQTVELCQAAHPPYPVVLSPLRPQCQSALALSALPAPQLVEPELQLPADAPWSILHHKLRGNGLPLGMGANGLLVADPKAYLSLLMAGTSDSGKTRFGVQLLITFALDIPGR